MADGMILPIVKYGHPALRQKGARVERVDADIRQLVSDMLDTMYEADGVGLAAQQVGQSLQLAVLDIRGVTERPSTLVLDGKEADPESIMPLVLINPEVKAVGEPVAGAEGCLSFPQIYADVVRPESVEVRATNLDGRTTLFRCGGLLAKAVQHEVDHLNGILYIDRMTRTVKAEIKAELELLMEDTKAVLEGAERRKSVKARERKPR